MKTKFNHLWTWIKSHKTWSLIILAVIVILAGWFFLGSTSDQKLNTVKVERGNIKEEISVTGNVKPLSDVDLAFERGGRVAVVSVSVGDRVYAGQQLASVSNADLLASLEQAKAGLKKVQAQFGNSADQTALDFTQSRNLLVNEVKDSYTKSDDAVRNKMYSLFDDPGRYNARLSFMTDTFLQEDIEDGKTDVEDLLDNWGRTLKKMSTSTDPVLAYSLAQTNLKQIKDLLDKCALAVNGLDSNLYPVTSIETWKANVSTARTGIISAINELTSAFDQYQSVGLSVKISADDTLVEEASVEQAKAQVASAEAELAKTIIRSPLTGIVTEVPIKLGEIVPANQKAMTVISYGYYEVETFVPEADIAKAKIGDKAKTTLDAYGSDIEFETSVIKIDPAATIIDGVPTYKVTLKFNTTDERVRSGMTANLDILTNERTDVLLLPTRAIRNQSNGKYVLVLDPLDPKKTVEKKIVTGLKGSDGTTEIISGLTLGEEVIL